MPLFLAANPFTDAFIASDFLGRAIFLGLIALSIISWSLLIYKTWLLRQVQLVAKEMEERFAKWRHNPLAMEIKGEETGLNPFLHLYSKLKSRTLEILNKNRHFALKEEQKEGEEKKRASYLSSSDIDQLQGHLFGTIAKEIRELEKNLYILSIIVSLAPFLGLLGTVWGILLTFSELQMQAGTSSQAMIGGLSLALATTVIGLLDAIPALIGYNYLKNSLGNLETDMENFAMEILTAVEFQYRQVDVQ